MMHRNMRSSTEVRKWDAESPDFATKYRITERKLAEDLHQSPILAISFQRKRLSRHFHSNDSMECSIHILVKKANYPDRGRPTAGGVAQKAQQTGLDSDTAEIRDQTLVPQKI